MYNEELISIIIPVYNVEKYLEKCINTIINQTYINIEVILVNDGSTDKSLNICNEFKEKDKRIKIINKKNGGLSDARNAGIKNAHGKYICFIDSDDYIHEKYVEELYNLIVKNNSQIAVCNFERVDEEGRCLSTNNIIAEVISGKKTIEKLSNKEFAPVGVVVWNKLYDINLFENIKYPIGKIHEDAFVIYKLYYLAEKVAITSKSLYYYRKVPTSIMNKKFNLKRLDILQALEERVKFFFDKGEDILYQLALIEYESTLIMHYVNCRRYLKNYKDIQKKLLKKFRKLYSKVIGFNRCLMIDKIRFSVAYISPTLYYYIMLAFKEIIKR